ASTRAATIHRDRCADFESERSFLLDIAQHPHWVSCLTAFARLNQPAKPVSSRTLRQFIYRIGQADETVDKTRHPRPQALKHATKGSRTCRQVAPEKVP